MNFLETFLDEAKDILTEWEEAIQGLASGFEEARIDQLFRAAHSLKGSSKSVSLDVFGSFVHTAEDLLTLVKQDPSIWNAELAAVFEELHEFLSYWRNALDEDAAFVPEQIESWRNRLATFAAASSPVETSSEEQQASFGFFEEEPSPVPSPAALQAKPVAATPAPKETKSTPPNSLNRSIRVPLDLIDRLARSLGEMTVTSEILKSAKNNHSLDSVVAQQAIDELARLTRESSMLGQSFKLSPIGELFSRMEKITYDTARKLDKQVQVRLIGAEIEIDKLILEKLKDPLMHIVRNAVDHGVETTTERTQVSKPSVATIRISAEVLGMEVVVRVRDDGKGLDTDKIRRKALGLGMIEEQDSLSDKSIHQFILSAGFSTADKVSEVSGRGVGMDVVKNAIESLGGKIEIDSEKGKGSRFSVHIPTNTSIVESLIVEDEGHVFALPLESVSDVFVLAEENAQEFEGGTAAILRGEECIPITPLGRTLAYDNSLDKSKTGVTVPCRGGLKGVVFEKIVREQTIFIRQIEGKLQQREDFLGSAILENGLPALVLNLSRLVER
ncbi:MAG: ATP-binding protein [Zetaproteobacteria bacterium]|nr:ATP-binding protein [Zetaproteobacteria bacterium]